MGLKCVPESNRPIAVVCAGFASEVRVGGFDVLDSGSREAWTTVDVEGVSQTRVGFSEGVESAILVVHGRTGQDRAVAEWWDLSAEKRVGMVRCWDAMSAENDVDVSVDGAFTLLCYAEGVGCFDSRLLSLRDALNKPIVRFCLSADAKEAKFFGADNRMVVVLAKNGMCARVYDLRSAHTPMRDITIMGSVEPSRWNDIEHRYEPGFARHRSVSAHLTTFADQDTFVTSCPDANEYRLWSWKENRCLDYFQGVNGSIAPITCRLSPWFKNFYGFSEVHGLSAEFSLEGFKMNPKGLFQRPTFYNREICLALCGRGTFDGIIAGTVNGTIAAWIPPVSAAED